MTTKTAPFNPSRFVDILSETFLAKGDKRLELRSKRQERVAWLRKKGRKSNRSLHLANKLDTCRRNYRCKSPACPECSDAAQRLVVRVAQTHLKAQTKKIVCVTVVPAGGTFNRGQLNKRAHELAIRRWRDRINKTGIPWLVGGTDWSWNEHEQKHYPPHWSLHFFGLTVTKNIKKLKRKLLKAFPKTKAIPRPVKVDMWDGNKKALRYIIKQTFKRRIGTNNATRFDKTTGGTRLCRATDKQPLRSKRRRELLVHLDDIGMQLRLFLCKCQIVHVRGLGPVIRISKAVGAMTNKRAKVPFKHLK
jgi:hypothetical protein